MKRKVKCNTQKASYATIHTGKNIHFHNNGHKADDRRTKNLNTQNTDPTDNSNKLLVLAQAIKIFTFGLRTAMAGDFPHWQERVCSEHTRSFQGRSANFYSNFQDLKISFGICLDGTATQPLETVKELVTYVFVYQLVNVQSFFMEKKKPGDSDIRNFCAKQPQHPSTTPHISSCMTENNLNLCCVRIWSQKKVLHL